MAVGGRGNLNELKYFINAIDILNQFETDLSLGQFFFFIWIKYSIKNIHPSSCIGNALTIDLMALNELLPRVEFFWFS